MTTINVLSYDLKLFWEKKKYFESKKSHKKFCYRGKDFTEHKLFEFEVISGTFSAITQQNYKKTRLLQTTASIRRRKKERQSGRKMEWTKE